jgi:hypothetical protein
MHARRLPLPLLASTRRPSRRSGMRVFSAGVAQLAEHLFCKQVVGGSSPPASSILFGTSPGGLPERPKGAGCKPAGIAYVGSNPTPSTVFCVNVGSTGGATRPFGAETSFRRSRRFVVRAACSVADVDLVCQDFGSGRGEACASQTTEVTWALAAVGVAKRRGFRPNGQASNPLNACATLAHNPNLNHNSRPSYQAGVAQLVEHQPSKLNVEGSNPFSRSTAPQAARRIGWPT